MTKTTFTPDPTLYPFESKWFESSVGPVHYIDEGDGRPILLMHGNPDWSFLYRKMIPLLTDEFRTIAIDYPGFGLSLHPEGYSYLPKDHAKVVSEFVTHLDLQDTILVIQDWGGPIGMDVASRDPDRFTALVGGNTFFFPATFPMMRFFSKLMGTRFMKNQILNKNFFVKRILKMMVQNDMTDGELAHYADVAPTPESRMGQWVFPLAITGEKAWLAEVEKRVDRTLLHLPLLRVMGMKDAPMTSKAMLAKWDEKFPNATKLDLPDAGHFWQEDAPTEIAAAIKAKYGRSG